MYVAVKGGEKAIDHAHRLLAKKRRGDPAQDDISIRQIQSQMPLAVARVMSEGALYDEELAALAIKQAAGDLGEAIFLLRAFRATLPRLGASLPLDTGGMRLSRRISATFKDLPGGQLLGPTFDYTHRLLDFSLADPPATTPEESDAPPNEHALPGLPPCHRVMTFLEREGLAECESARDSKATVPDITREPLSLPAAREERLQMLSRGDEGFLLAMGYSTQRGYGRNHPFAGEIRIGFCEVWLEAGELGFPISLGDIEVSECETVNQFASRNGEAPQFTRGYGLVFGYAERKAMSMALVDRALRATEYGEEIASPAQQEEFVLMHCDSVEAAGFVSHLKLPHYVDFQSELDLLRQIRRETAGEAPATACACAEGEAA